MLAAKFFSSSNNEGQEALWSQNPWHKDTVASRENMMNQGKFCLRSQFACTMTFHQVASPLTALKIIFIYVQGCENRNPTQIHMDMCEIRSRNLNFVILDRYSFYRVAVQHQHYTSIDMIRRSIFRALIAHLHLFLGQICMSSILNLNTCVLKY